MIKTITKQIFMCDMCGRECGGSINRAVVPEDVFEFTVNLADGAINIQICTACQAKLRTALEDKSNSLYNIKHCGCDERRKEQ